MKSHLFVFALLVGSLSSLASEPPSKASAPNCGALETQGEMNECFSKQAKLAQALLDRLLTQLRVSLAAGERKGLDAVQSQWVKYRDAHCEWQAHFSEGGSIQPMMYSICIETTTWSRIDELKADLCEGEGMTGECDASRKYDRSTSARQ